MGGSKNTSDEGDFEAEQKEIVPDHEKAELKREELENG